MTGNVIFFLDYDGTLVGIRKKPGLARMGKRARAILKSLSRNRNVKVFIVSGRTLSDIKRLVGIKSLYYAGNHGIELEGPDISYLNPDARAMRPFIQKAYRSLKKRVRIDGVMLENKIYTLSVHYRLARPGEVPALKKILKSVTKNLSKLKKIKITKGKKVLEIRPNTKWNKGSIVKWVMKRKKGLPIFIGDDKTDEDAFRAIGKNGITILVSKNKNKTRARYRLKSPEEVLVFLKKFAF